MKYIIIILFLSLNYGCKKEIIRENEPIKKDSGISQIVKSDIDNVLEIHVSESRELLKELMSKLYKRNPSELKKSPNKIAEENSYLEQIKEMEENGLQEVSFDELNDLNFKKEHQEFLQKLLTSKDSFVRKRIIEQNLAFLNKRLTYYLNTIGLPHKVVFQNDLSIEITELGRDLDFDNLSRGERNRLILSLSWAFRDVWENLYQPINLLFIDELVDSGMDASGVESSLAVLKKMARDRKKSIWLISHRDELAGRVNNVLTVQKENGFTSYNNDVKLT